MGKDDWAEVKLLLKELCANAYSREGPLSPDTPVNRVTVSATSVDNDGREHVTGYKYSGGLTARELFAGMAMQGAISSPDVFYSVAPSHVAKCAVDYADALIGALAKKAE